MEEKARLDASFEVVLRELLEIATHLAKSDTARTALSIRRAVLELKERADGEERLRG